jgi:hypothetical protein
MTWPRREKLPADLDVGRYPRKVSELNTLIPRSLAKAGMSESSWIYQQIALFKLQIS